MSLPLPTSKDLGRIKNLSHSTGEQRGKIIVSRSQCIQNSHCEFVRNKPSVRLLEVGRWLLLVLRLSRSEEGQGENFLGESIRNMPGGVIDCWKPRDMGRMLKKEHIVRKSSKARGNELSISLHIGHLLDSEANFRICFSPGHCLLILYILTSCKCYFSK